MKKQFLASKQLSVFLTLMIVYALTIFLTYAFFMDQLTASAATPMPDMGIPDAVFGLVTGGIMFVLYGLLGLAGYWFARKLGLPGIFSEDGNWRGWFLIPLVIGLASGILFVILDMAFAPINGFGLMVHPGFPVSVMASISAGIGEEIIFRGFVFGLWAFILNWLFKRFNGRNMALWIANIIAALAFGASHFGTILVLTGASSISELSPMLIVEIFLLNGILGIIAGQRAMKDGLVAAMGIHFWTDIVFHVIWGLF